MIMGPLLICRSLIVYDSKSSCGFDRFARRENLTMP